MLLAAVEVKIYCSLFFERIMPKMWQCFILFGKSKLDL